jgi:hypothetical protein
MSAPHPPSSTGVIFSSALLPESEKTLDSAGSSRTASIHDAEKAEGTLEQDEKALANYLVPALAKGQKNARLKPPTYWTRFRVWYNPYRMVSVFLRKECAAAEQ